MIDLACLPSKSHNCAERMLDAINRLDGRAEPRMNDFSVQARLAELRQEHRDLDAAIAALVASGDMDQLRMARLKRQKLRLKDEISAWERQLVPDIIA